MSYYRIIVLSLRMMKKRSGKVLFGKLHGSLLDLRSPAQQRMAWKHWKWRSDFILMLF
jgi:hypothetical protein